MTELKTLNVDTDIETLLYDAADDAELMSLVAPKEPDQDVPTKERLAEVGATPLVDQDGFSIDITRPILVNEDGSLSTEETTTLQGWELGLGNDTRWYNVPTIVNGERVTENEWKYDAAIRLQNGHEFPNFDSQEEASRAAADRSNYLGTIVTERKRMIDANAPGVFAEGGVLDRVLGGAGVRTANQIIQTGYELAEVMAENVADAAGISFRDEVTGMTIPREYMIQFPPAPQFDDRAEAQNGLEEMLRDISQFAITFIATRRLGTSTPAQVGRSGIAAAFFDPEEGGIVKAMQSGLGLPMLEFLNVAEGADLESAEGRLTQRLQFVLEDVGLAGMVGGIVESLKFIRKHPVLMNSLIGTLATAGFVYSSEAEAGPGGKIIRLTSKDVANIDTSVKGLGLTPSEAKVVKDEVRRVKGNYPKEDGWMPLSVATPGAKKDGTVAPAIKATKNGYKIKWEKAAYKFDKPPRGVSYKKHLENMTNRTVDDVRSVVERAKAGDQAAIDILQQANWYRSMRTRLRSEFGGLGDVFADLLGATSANTDVRANWNNGIEALRRFTNGDFDEEIKAYMARLEAGESVDPGDLTRAFKEGEFPLITKESGKLFGINSPAATKALLDMFRQIKAGDAPKTINFTGNLIGFGTQPTIDVWAARYLRDAAGLPRIPPPAEKAVAGKHLTGSTLDNPKVGSEFGAGQRVFTDAANEINAQGFVKEFAPDVGELGPDDLQAVVWFIEKEKWTKNGWTNKAGEGGSLDYEASLAGAPERAEIDQLRTVINSSKSTPEDVAAAQARLDELSAPVERRVVGVSRERPDARPTNVEQAELSSEVLSPLKDDPSVIGSQANNTYGVFFGESERSLNTEIVTRKDFDETKLIDNVVDLGRKYDQDAVYVSKVVPRGTPNAMPGLEIFFRSRQEAERAIALLDSLRQKYDIAGGTIITDARYKDRPDVQVDTGDEVAGAVGIRIQYIPEFAGEAMNPNPDKWTELFFEVAFDLADEADISSTNVLYFDNKVFKNTDREGAEWIEGGVSYEDSITGRARSSETTGTERRSPDNQNGQSAGSGGEVGQVE